MFFRRQRLWYESICNECGTDGNTESGLQKASLERVLSADDGYAYTAVQRSADRDSQRYRSVHPPRAGKCRDQDGQMQEVLGLSGEYVLRRCSFHTVEYLAQYLEHRQDSAEDIGDLRSLLSLEIREEDE